MSAYQQLLHEEEFHRGGQPYKLSVYRADGGIMGRWRCGVCHSEYDHEDCLTYSTVDGCLDSMKRAIHEGPVSAQSARSCPCCPA